MSEVSAYHVHTMQSFPLLNQPCIAVSAVVLLSNALGVSYCSSLLVGLQLESANVSLA